MSGSRQFFSRATSMSGSVRRLLTHLLLYAGLVSCVAPYQPETKSLGYKALIVDGFITDQPGPHQLNLTYSADFTANVLTYFAAGAAVYLTDDLGNRQSFTELGGGIYQTPASFQGQPGRAYKLAITLPDGRQYESQPEKLASVSPIDRIYEEYTEVPGANSTDKGFNVYLDTKDPATPGNYYRWIATHFEPITVCSVKTVEEGGIPTDYSYACCQDCWDVVRCKGGNCNNVTSDELINGKSISRQFMLRAPYTSPSGYYLEVEQLSLSKEAYLYYKTLENLTKNNGGIFDVAPAPLRGNIASVTNPNELVFGYFSASGSQKVPYVVDRRKGSGSPNFVVPPRSAPTPPATCVPCAENGVRTRTRPRWWPF